LFSLVFFLGRFKCY